ncbi:MAG: enoyl-CoA hydratase-related protein [Chloroflexota bacterium]|nr:enoyl-CoA hydratase-related protein [Chloroflexota bacterium]
MDNDVLLVEKKETNVCILTLNRPDKRNSLSLDLIAAIYKTFQDLSKDDSIRGVVIRGNGDKAFCAGYDIQALPTNDNPEIRDVVGTKDPLQMAFQSVIEYPYPVIAMINGAAYGAGYELAVCCDLRVGSDRTRIGMPPAKIGVVYPPMGLQRFIRTIGMRNTKEMFFTGNTYEGSRIREMALVDYMVSDTELESFTLELAGGIAGNAPLSVKGTKRILNLLTMNHGMSDQDRMEAEGLVAAAFNSEDLKEGQMAFFQKRTPQFRGR